MQKVTVNVQRSCRLTSLSSGVVLKTKIQVTVYLFGRMEDQTEHVPIERSKEYYMELLDNLEDITKVKAPPQFVLPDDSIWHTLNLYSTKKKAIKKSVNEQSLESKFQRLQNVTVHEPAVDIGVNKNRRAARAQVSACVKKAPLTAKERY